MTQAIDHDSTTDSNHLRSRFKELKDCKNQFLGRLEEISKRIRLLISQIKEKKSNRNALTDQVKVQKEQRSALSKEIRDKIEVVKKVQTKIPPLYASSKDDRRESPQRLKARMDELNRRIETEALPFDKEQALMKQIKEIKVVYDKAVKESAGRQDSIKLSREINELKAKADASHELVQRQAKESQAIHEEILKMSMGVEALKKEESSVKGSFNAAKSELDKISAKLDSIRSKARQTGSEQKERSHREYEEHTKKRLIQRIESVHEKIKKGGKLTTEDLIILQGEEGPIEEGLMGKEQNEGAVKGDPNGTSN